MNNNTKPQLEACRKMAAQLRWNEKNAEASARIVISKAIWSGLDADQVIQMICGLTDADYVRKNLHILFHAVKTISNAAQYTAHPAAEVELMLDGIY